MPWQKRVSIDSCPMNLLDSKHAPSDRPDGMGRLIGERQSPYSVKHPDTFPLQKGTAVIARSGLIFTALPQTL